MRFANNQTEDIELNNKKRREYTLALIFLSIHAFITLIVVEILKSEGVFNIKLFGLYVLIWGSIMYYICYHIAINLTKNKIYANILVSIMIMGLISSIGSNILIENGNEVLGLAICRFGIILTILSLGWALILNISDIFLEQHTFIYRIWGAVSMFLSIGTALFPQFYCLAETLNFGALDGIANTDIMQVYLKAYRISFYMMSSMDTPLPNASALIMNIASIQSCVFQLFVIFIIGRLLNK